MEIADVKNSNGWIKTQLVLNSVLSFLVAVGVNDWRKQVPFSLL